MDQLTKTENKVAHLIALGYLGKEIADVLCVSAHTVHAHMRNIRKKLQANNIADITREYIMSLDDPKLLYKAVLFLVLQLGMTFSGTHIDLRKPPARVVRAQRSKTKTKDYYV